MGIRFIAHVRRETKPPECILANGAKLLVPPLIANYVAAGDEITFPRASLAASEETELCVKKKSHFIHSSELYQAPIGSVTLPKKDTRSIFLFPPKCFAGEKDRGDSEILVPRSHRCCRSTCRAQGSGRTQGDCGHPAAV